MKRSRIFVLLCLVLMLYCRDNAATEWYDADTLRITAGGFAEENSPEESAVLNSEKACRAARLNAMALAAVTLGEAGSHSVTDFQRDGAHFSAFISGGTVLSRTFDPVSNKCTVVYELKEKGLKEKAKRASRQK